MRDKNYTTLIWLCDQCTSWVVNNDVSGYDDVIPPIDPREWFAVDDAEITCGMIGADHEPGCPARDDDKRDECYGCTHDDFSTRTCGRCGTTLAGGREAFTVWM